MFPPTVSLAHDNNEAQQGPGTWRGAGNEEGQFQAPCQLEWLLEGREESWSFPRRSPSHPLPGGGRHPCSKPTPGQGGLVF